jgi:hypothetical protein
MQTLDRCAVCENAELDPTAMSRAIVEGRAVSLCRSHAAAVALAMPRTFDELRLLFVGATLDAGGVRLDERRSPISRRAVDDRRAFPPRPEGRRASIGRRAGER